MNEILKGAFTVIILLDLQVGNRLANICFSFNYLSFLMQIFEQMLSFVIGISSSITPKIFQSAMCSF